MSILLLKNYETSLNEYICFLVEKNGYFEQIIENEFFDALNNIIETEKNNNSCPRSLALCLQA